MDDHEYKKMIEEVLAKDVGLTSWEMDFIESVDTLVKFTEKQRDVIERIWKKVCG